MCPHGQRRCFITHAEHVVETAIANADVSSRMQSALSRLPSPTAMFPSGQLDHFPSGATKSALSKHPSTLTHAWFITLFYAGVDHDERRSSIRSHEIRGSIFSGDRCASA